MGLKTVLRLLPRSWRERYGEELGELLDTTRQPVRDSIDVALLALGVRVDHARSALGRTRFTLVAARALSLLLGLLGILGGGWSVSRLHHGALEIPGHWWSTLATAPLALGLLLGLIAWRRTRLWAG